MLSACMVNENATHGLRGNAEELRAIAPLDTTLIDETQIRFVHECGGLKRVFAGLSAHGARGLPVQLRINRRQELFAGGCVATAPREEEPGDVGGWRAWALVIRFQGFFRVRE